MTEIYEGVRKEIAKSLNEFRWELQKPGALINADTLVVLQGAFIDQILAIKNLEVIDEDAEMPDSPYAEAADKGNSVAIEYTRGYYCAHQDMEGWRKVVKK